MKSRTGTQNHTNAAPSSILGGKGTFRGALTLLATFVTILSIIGLSSCAGYTSAANQTLTPSTGTLTPSTTTLAFGNVAVGSAALQSISVTNTGTATVNIGTATITGAGFTFIGGNPSTSIPVGQSSTVQIQFAPTSTGAVTGAITVTSDSTNSPLTVSITGTGTQSALTIAPVSVSFGNVTVGQTSSQTVKLTNTGNSSLTINPATVSGAPFTMSGLALPAVIAAGQNISFTVQFAPTASGAATGTVSFTDNGPSSPQTLVLVGTGVDAGATLNSTPGSVAFGNVVVGANSSQTITLANTGTASITISQATAAGAGFSISGLAAGKVISAGGNTTFSAKFAPTTAGNLTGTITIASNATNPTVTIAMTGTGAVGALSANPTSIPFGSLLVNTSSTVSVTLTNSGTASTTISSSSVTGTGYSISGLTANQVIAAGQTAVFTAKFAPTAVGTPVGTITINSNAPGSPILIGLTGAAVASQAQMTISPASENFGSVAVGANNPQTITLTNVGNQTLTISAASISGTGFSMSGLTAPVTILAGAKATFIATFTPTAAGSATGAVSITSNAPGSPATIALTGTGTGAGGSANPGSASFGNVVMGSNNSQSITLKNNGNVTLTFSQISITGGPGFSVSGISTATTIAAGASMSFNAVFTPGSLTSVTGSLALVTNGTPSVLTIPLSGTGVAATFVLGSNPTSLAFGEVNINTNSSLTSILTNTGNSNVTISGVATAGTGITASGIANGLVLQPNQTATLTVKYAPTATGPLAGASVTITSNASALVIALSGTGVQHSVSLSWAGSTTSDVTGYYVYRSTTFGSGYAKVNPGTPVAASTTQYTDTTVQAALTYYYVVTAVDSSGVESADSNQSTAVIP